MISHQNSSFKISVGIRNATDFSPFGVELKGRNFEVVGGGNYRYSFQGQETDDEVKGDGNSYDFGARMYDSRVGRWLSIDPLFGKYPAFTPYSFVNNMPVSAFDPNGKEIIIVSNWVDKNHEHHQMAVRYENGKLYDKNGNLHVPLKGGYFEKVQSDLNLLQNNAGDRAENVVNVLQNSDAIHYIGNDIRGYDSKVKDRNVTLGDGTGGSYTHYTPFVDQPSDVNANTPYPRAINKAITLIHELTHAYDNNQRVPNSESNKDINGVKACEVHACSVENSVRKFIGEEIRKTYGTALLPVESNLKETEKK